MLNAFQFIAVLATTLFTGAAAYISLVEHPARMSCSTEVAATEWAPSYKRATFMQAPLAIIGFLAGFVVWWLNSGILWLTAAIIMLSIVPFTILVVGPVNKQLLSPSRDPGSTETHELLVKWGKLHVVRTLLSLVASFMLIWKAVD